MQKLSRSKVLLVDDLNKTGKSSDDSESSFQKFIGTTGGNALGYNTDVSYKRKYGT